MPGYMILKTLKIYLFVFFICICSTLRAQELPNVQNVSVRIPATSKIDGKANEWNNKYQSYNSVDRLFYTMANNDTALYIIIQVPGARTLQKIVDGGVKLTIPHSSKSVEKSSSVIFPIINSKRWLLTVDAMVHYFLYAEQKKDTTLFNKRKVDSMMTIVNQLLVSTFKEIQVSGIDKINEPAISLNNKYHIFAMAQFNDQMALVYELSIPLKYLGLDIIHPQKFRYNVKLTGPPLGSVSVNDIDDGPKDFWGEYTLIK